jgi:hypothetical protein
MRKLPDSGLKAFLLEKARSCLRILPDKLLTNLVEVSGRPVSDLLEEKDFQLFVLKQRLSVLELEMNQLTEMLRVVSDANLRKVIHTQNGVLIGARSDGSEGKPI